MDDRDVDALVRLLAAGETRRAALRLLAGGALAGLAARLGLAEGAEAKKQRQRRPEPKRQDKLQPEGKRKGKKQGKNKAKPRPKPCGPNEHRCGPGPCIPINQCCSNQKRCADGSCVSQGACCPGEKVCVDGSCVATGACCPGERRCADGSCTPFHLCCQGEKPCGDIECIPVDECCEFDPPPLCGECEAVVCEHGAWACRTDCGCAGYPACRPGMEHNPDTCICECPAGSRGCDWFCCPSSHPQCYSEGGFKTWCLNDDWDAVCPIGWTPYRDSGLCYPGIPA
jgi:hypothetical protein